MNTRLKLIRKELHLSQQQLADFLHVSRKTYGIYERGERPLTPHMIHILQERLGIPPERLRDESGPSPVFPASGDEEDLLRMYRRLDPAGKNYIMDVLVCEESLSDLYRKNRPR